ncbi:MAG: hypothetical protein UT05_C0010G0006 [Parcubacteria group bacterium GW2011_GWF2_38_76]|nr:MAG: hypothetical protein UT05_C0010G0006 [Parcubacteria group bacterium GW2011_GWF2_38_76]HBM45564.1 hypothetical protein [Patescibacteria group bacterium]
MKDIYKSQSWKKIDVVVRIDLITVVEKIRIGGKLEIPLKYIRTGKECVPVDKKQRILILSCLKELKLKFKEIGNSLYVFWEQSNFDKLENGEIKIGEFLGYPNCCSEAFYKRCEKFLKNKSPIGPAQIFWIKQKMAAKEGKYNDDLDFWLHIPCELNCKETLAMVSKIRKVLEENDPEAAVFFQELHKKYRT